MTKQRLYDEIMESLLSLGGSAKVSKLTRGVAVALVNAGESVDIDEVRAEIWRLVDTKQLQWTNNREIAINVWHP